MARYLMLQGTGSHVGKSVLAAALCRILWRSGYRVAPFKAQNMALNSYVTTRGEEMARAQVVQAWAARLEPEVDMNPVLLKPTGNSRSQVVLLGRPIGDISAREYHRDLNCRLLGEVEQALQRLSRRYEVIIMEGAGSPAEINLKEQEIANMRVAKLVGAPVLLVADIDRGGALAAIVGTLELLDPEERDLVEGLVINKFRGDVELLRPALDFLERRTGKPVLGVIPYLEDLGLPEEDSVALEEYRQAALPSQELQVAVIQLPRISNFTDFDALARHPGVRVSYVSGQRPLGRPDLVILPGSKNTIADLQYLRHTGKDEEIVSLARQGVPVVGICGGYQMLGREVRDPEGVEAAVERAEGLGLLEVVTEFRPEKATFRCHGVVCGGGPLLGACHGLRISGYEIHMGESRRLGSTSPVVVLTRRGEEEIFRPDGAVNTSGLVFGTYVHGLFDNDFFREKFLEALRRYRGRAGSESAYNYWEQIERSFDRLADTVAAHLDLARLSAIMGLPRPLKGAQALG
ncbi:MAG: cobyric acid synthase [Moorellales bacterium]